MVTSLSNRSEFHVDLFKTMSAAVRLFPVDAMSGGTAHALEIQSVEVGAVTSVVPPAAPEHP